MSSKTFTMGMQDGEVMTARVTVGMNRETALPPGCLARHSHKPWESVVSGEPYPFAIAKDLA